MIKVIDTLYIFSILFTMAVMLYGFATMEVIAIGLK